MSKSKVQKLMIEMEDALNKCNERLTHFEDNFRSFNEALEKLESDTQEHLKAYLGIPDLQISFITFAVAFKRAKDIFDGEDQ